MNAANEECFATQVVALLTTYPPEVVAELARPGAGIVVKTKWLPSVFEIKEEADRLLVIPRRMIEIDDAEQKQIAERDAPRAERMDIAGHAAALVERLRAQRGQQ